MTRACAPPSARLGPLPAHGALLRRNTYNVWRGDEVLAGEEPTLYHTTNTFASSCTRVAIEGEPRAQPPSTPRQLTRATCTELGASWRSRRIDFYVQSSMLTCEEARGPP